MDDGLNGLYFVIWLALAPLFLAVAFLIIVLSPFWISLLVGTIKTRKLEQRPTVKKDQKEFFFDEEEKRM